MLDSIASAIFVEVGGKLGEFVFPATTILFSYCPCANWARADFNVLMGFMDRNTISHMAAAATTMTHTPAITALHSHLPNTVYHFRNIAYKRYAAFFCSNT